MSGARRYRSVFLPGFFLAVLFVLAFGADLIAPFDPIEMDISGRLKPPSSEHWLGQDEYGRDIFSRLLHGARVSLTVALLSSMFAMIIGVTLGLIGGYFRGISELLTLRIVDIVLSFPPILLALLVVTLFGPGAVTLTACLTILFAPGFARVTYGETLSVRAQDYVEATRALGASSGRIVLGTVLPNVTGPIIVQFSLTVASAILIESGLSFLGLGVVPPDPSWGLMIRSARGYMNYSSLGLVWPCLALIVTVLLFNALCDGLRDMLDPKAKPVNLPPRQRDAPIAASAIEPDALLQVSDLHTHIAAQAGIVRAVEGVGFSLTAGETVAIVGESGSGKSMTGLSLMQLVPRPGGAVVGGSILFRRESGEAVDLARADDAVMETIRGNEIAMIFQEPMTALNPVYRIGDQIAEVIKRHRDVSDAEAKRMTFDILDKVGIPEPKTRAFAFPHELSGGLRQRAMIAMAMVLKPRLLIADEPTTALDVTIQAQILDLLRTILKDNRPQPALIFITHDLGITAELADRVLVFYAGHVVEEAPSAALFERPRHPYTRGLIDSAPTSTYKGRLKAIEGSMPDPFNLPDGCAFAPRCRFADDRCRHQAPPLVDIDEGRRSRCWHWEHVT